MNYLQLYQRAHHLIPDGIIGKKTVNVMMRDLQINSIVEFCHFIAQIKHESNNFKAGRENLNYGIAALRKLFGRYFTHRELYVYAGHPEKIANRIYANRLGNGNESSGDGWRYRGTAAIQLTGKNNTQAYFKNKHLPLDTDPNDLLQPEHYFNTAKFFFDVNNVWQYCTGTSNECVIKTSKKINLGNALAIRNPIGLAARLQISRELFNKFC